MTDNKWDILPAHGEHSSIEVNVVTCIGTMPCQHYVRQSGSGVVRSSEHVANLFTDRGLPVPEHFARDQTEARWRAESQDMFAALETTIEPGPSKPQGWVVLPAINGHQAVSINVSKCRKSLPCKHDVLFADFKARSSLNGRRIADLFVERGLPAHEHFAEYLAEPLAT